jgi:uncharacterized protein YjbI with pentapeptide repeats
MAHLDILERLKQGVVKWNSWRVKNKEVEIDLRGANLKELNLMGYNLSKANLGDADLSGAILICANLADCLIDDADLSKADLRSADLSNAVLDGSYMIGCNLEKANLNESHICGSFLSGANLTGATLCFAEICESNLTVVNLKSADLREVVLSGTDLSFSDLTDANLSRADLSEASLHNANLTNTDLTKAVLVETDISGARLDGTKVYGISCWDLLTDNSVQRNLVITKDGQPSITVDDLEIAQLIYLFLNNGKIRNVIETVTTKAVLILGRFTDERKKVLDSIRDELRQRNFLPIVFDFEKPSSRDLTETISILAKLSRYVIADLTDAKSIPQELSHIIPFLTKLPVIPILLQGQREYGMFEHWKSYPWVLPIYEYADEEHLLSTLTEGVIEPAEQKLQELRKS